MAHGPNGCGQLAAWGSYCLQYYFICIHNCRSGEVTVASALRFRNQRQGPGRGGAEVGECLACVPVVDGAYLLETWSTYCGSPGRWEDGTTALVSGSANKSGGGGAGGGAGGAGLMSSRTDTRSPGDWVHVARVLGRRPARLCGAAAVLQPARMDAGLCLSSILRRRPAQAAAITHRFLGLGQSPNFPCHRQWCLLASAMSASRWDGEIVCHGQRPQDGRKRISCFFQLACRRPGPEQCSKADASQPAWSMLQTC
ncbi:hypothetical protein F4780DRAFT_364693 [Xylariomycetidae sp. FL0641]|nr:hypothetical protein F4780DRAFT_364693 [Xylariomycetidae sp. FL0641]